MLRDIPVVCAVSQSHCVLGLNPMACFCLSDLSVEFPIYRGSSRSLKKSLFAASTRGNLARDATDRVNVRALSNINLEFSDGGRIGLIGSNGAGKTTLLKVLAGIYEPTTGQLFSVGKVSALLDTSFGLDPDATGRENIVLRGMYMGIRPRDMQRHIEDVMAFTELGDYLEMPVRTYSSGMMVRLSFAAATCIQPEILLLDEWLSAGDARFLERARRRMERFVRVSSILVLASHSPSLLKEWCTRGIYLENGRLKVDADIDTALAAYKEAIDASQPQATLGA
jgi:ABC-type polysaccharide/polyol phosphate transport system ATPase subunit